MKNIETKVTGKKLVITIDLSQDFGDSKSGKTTIIASTGGNQNIEGTDGIIMGINVFKKKK